MILIKNLLWIIGLSNAFLSCYIVFHRRRSVATTWAWLIVLLIFPVLGLIIYSFLGRGISQENLFAINKQHHIGLRNVQKMITKAPRTSNPRDTSQAANVLIRLLNHRHDSPLTKNNQVELVTDAKVFFSKLIADLTLAQATINIEFYSFYNDTIGNQILHLLIQKAQAGVKVHLLYDAWGSLGASQSWFYQLRQVGGKVLPFVTSRNAITRYRINYHLHRKIVVIDGRTSWTGGFNIGDQYVGQKKKFGYWRDTQVRLQGSASLLLQERFVMDWNASIHHPSEIITFDTQLFPDLDENDLPTNAIATQVVFDGPDRDDSDMRNGMIRLMLLARKRLYIQTPYLIPDSALFAAWEIIAKSGIDVRIMIPCKPDHPFIYRATQWYANELTKSGIKIYTYNRGFLHAKTILVDDKYATVGSVNQDYRSYHLNFEDNVIFYDRDFNQKMAETFEHDLTHSTLLTSSDFEHQNRWLKTLQAFSRMLSPIL